MACKGRKMTSKDIVIEEVQGKAYCYICTHVVDAVVLVQGRLVQTKPGQRCSRCNASLNAGSGMEVVQAA